MNKVYRLLLLIALIVTATSCQDKYPDLKDGIYAEIETSKGTIVAQLEYEKAPLTVGNFVALAEGKHPKVADSLKGKPYYDGLTFHRVMSGFMIQGGDMTATGAGDVGYKFPQEVSAELKHEKGALSMANAGPDTNGSQFFIMHEENPGLNMRYNVFGKVVMNQSVVDSIATNTKVDAQNKPLEDVKMTKVTIIRKGDAAKKWDAVKAFNNGVAAFDKEQAAEKKRLDQVTSAKSSELVGLKSQATALPGGVMVYTVQKGTGGKPKTGEIVKLGYSGFLSDGNLFDSSDKEISIKFGKYNPNREAAGAYGPMPLQIDPAMQMIEGFKEAVLSMNYGDEIVAFIPSDKAYGTAGNGSVIPPNTDLIFELKMEPKEN